MNKLFWKVKLALAIVVVGLLMTSSWVASAPENPSAPVDLINVETIFGGQYGVPGDPGQPIAAYIQVKNLSTSPQYVLVQIYESQNDTTIVSIATWISESGDRIFSWLPSWTFKSTPDTLRVRVWYWDYGINGWAFADKAVGWVQADELIYCEPPNHCPYSPNMYMHLRRWSSPDPNFHWVAQRFWYFDNNYYGDTNGTDRMNRLRQHTNALPNNGKFQVEFRRTDPNSWTNKEGWDSVVEQWSGPICLPMEVGIITNLPGTRGIDLWVDHEELAGVCGQFQGDEEVQVMTMNTESMLVYSGQDPTNIHTINNAPIYRVEVKFYRRPAQQGQTFSIRSKFDLSENLTDILLDQVQPTHYPNWNY